MTIASISSSSSSRRLLDSLPYADGDVHPDYEAYALTLVEQESQSNVKQQQQQQQQLHPDLVEDKKKRDCSHLLPCCSNDYDAILQTTSKKIKDYTYIVEAPKKDDDENEWKIAVQRARAAYEESVHRWTDLQVLHHILPSIQKRWQDEVLNIKQKNQFLETIVLPTIQNDVQDINTQRYDAQVVSQTGVQFQRYQVRYQQLLPKCQSIQLATNTLQTEIKNLKQSLQDHEDKNEQSTLQ